MKDFNPRSPSGLRRLTNRKIRVVENISIHAARVGCDQGWTYTYLPLYVISIHAARVGCDPIAIGSTSVLPRISIHAARVGCDLKQFPVVHPKHDFNPRSPSGLRPYIPPYLYNKKWNFNPRSPSGLRPNFSIS